MGRARRRREPCRGTKNCGNAAMADSDKRYAQLIGRKFLTRINRKSFLDTVREFFAVSEVQMEAFTQRFLTKLPQHLQSALGFTGVSNAA